MANFSMYENQFEVGRNENYSVISPENYEENRKISAMKKITEELVEKLRIQKQLMKEKAEKVEREQNKKREWRDQV